MGADGPVIGNDGLTDEERAEYAAAYAAGAGRKWLSEGEKAAIDKWQAARTQEDKDRAREILRKTLDSFDLEPELKEIVLKIDARRTKEEGKE